MIIHLLHAFFQIGFFCTVVQQLQVVSIVGKQFIRV